MSENNLENKNQARESRVDEQASRNRRSSDSELTEVIAHLTAFQERHMKTHDTMLKRDLFWRNLRAAFIAIAIVLVPMIYTIGLNNILSPQKLDEPYAAIVRIDGMIAADSGANARKITSSLRRAFEDEEAQGIILLVNSPGGQPVQSAIIFNEIMRLKEKYPERKVIAVGEDMMTSGAYFVSVAADKIYINRSTWIGSIGVIMKGWGFDHILKKYDVDRRVFTAGTNKSRLDPFQPLKPEDVKKARELLQATHNHFIDTVKKGRGDRLVGDPDVIFSGDFWDGPTAVKLGLADAIGDLGYAMEKELGATRIKDYTVTPSLLNSITNRFGTSVENMDQLSEVKKLFRDEVMAFKMMMLPN